METFTSVSVRAFGGSSLWLLDQLMDPKVGDNSTSESDDFSANYP